MNDIELTRGDTLNLSIDIVDSTGQQYVLEEGDRLTFTVKINPYTDEIIMQKEIIDNSWTISPDDTKKLSYGTYKYDIQLNFANGDVCTVIKPSNFKITEEVNYD